MHHVIFNFLKLHYIPYLWFEHTKCISHLYKQSFMRFVRLINNLRHIYTRQVALCKFHMFFWNANMLFFIYLRLPENEHYVCIYPNWRETWINYPFKQLFGVPSSVHMSVFTFFPWGRYIPLEFYKNVDKLAQNLAPTKLSPAKWVWKTLHPQGVTPPYSFYDNPLLLKKMVVRDYAMDRQIINSYQILDEYLHCKNTRLGTAKFWPSSSTNILVLIHLKFHLLNYCI